MENLGKTNQNLNRLWVFNENIENELIVNIHDNIDCNIQITPLIFTTLKNTDIPIQKSKNTNKKNNRIDSYFP